MTEYCLMGYNYGKFGTVSTVTLHLAMDEAQCKELTEELFKKLAKGERTIEVSKPEPLVEPIANTSFRIQEQA